MEWVHQGYRLTDDQRVMDVAAIHALLETTYWANSRPRQLTEAAMRHSVCLGVFHEGRQVGFARAVTDQATFTWICDVVVHPDHRARGLGKRLMECLLAHPALQTVTHLLRTRDAHGLYEPFGFQREECMRRSLVPP